MSKNPIVAVTTLLEDLFNRKSLQQFISNDVDVRVANEINFDDGLTTVVFDAASALQKHGWLKEVGFWDALRAAFPNQQQRIVEVMGAWVVTAAPPRGREPWDAVVPANTGDQLRISLLGADVDQSRPLRIDLEYREIQRQITQGGFRERIQCEVNLAPTWGDLRSALLSRHPHVLHFSGHGEEDGSVMFAQEDGTPEWIPAKDIADVLRILQGELALVVLNACYSEVLARHIEPLGVAVIGMNDAISDVGAIAFSRVLYEALANRTTVRQAFDLGCLELRRGGFGEEVIPVLRPRSAAQPGGK